jgi:hypothetical protein
MLHDLKIQNYIESYRLEKNLIVEIDENLYKDIPQFSHKDLKELNVKSSNKNLIFKIDDILEETNKIILIRVYFTAMIIIKTVDINKGSTHLN